MTLAQVRPMQAILRRVNGIATDADLLAADIHDALLDAADQGARLADKLVEARAEVQRLDALLAAAQGANDPREAMRQCADAMRERLGPVIAAVIVETATMPTRGERSA